MTDRFTRAVMVVLLATIIYATYIFTRPASAAHECMAPCTVHFTPLAGTMQEDNFGIDYHDKVLDVFWSAPDWVED